MAFKQNTNNDFQSDFELKNVMKDRSLRENGSRKFVTAKIVESDIQFGELSGASGQSVIFSGKASSGNRPPFSFSYKSPNLSDVEKFKLADKLKDLKQGSEMTFAGSWSQNSGQWEMTAQRLATGSVDSEAFKLGSNNQRVLWHAGYDDKFFEPEKQDGKKYEIDNTTPVKLSASMYFAYSGESRPEIASKTTFDAILDGERSSTTRFPQWGGIQRWESLKKGDLIRFFDDKNMKGKSVVVAVDSISRIDLSACAESDLKGWSKAEGWSEGHGRQIGRR
jgi:hypothetical protein